MKINIKQNHKLYVISLLVVLLLISSLFSIKKQYFNGQSFCKNPVKLEDNSDRKKLFTVCSDKIFYDNILVTDKSKNPEIFDTKLATPKLEVVIYSIDSRDLILIFPIASMATWYAKGVNVFVNENGKHKEIFKRGIDELSGRWRGVEIMGQDSIYSSGLASIVVNQDLGSLQFEGDRISWSDYYDFDKQNLKFVLANNKHKYEFEKKKKIYEEQDSKFCSGESPVLIGKKISDLYPTRKSFEHFCFDESSVPYVSKGQATIFLKAKKAIDRILGGENLSINDIKDIEF